MADTTKKEQIMLVFHFTGEPNEARMTAFHFDDNHITVKPFCGWEVMDIYELLVNAEKPEEN